MNEQPHGDDDEATAIVAAARRRALGGSRGARQLGVVLWASFIGAIASLMVLLLLPDEGWLPLDSTPKLALGFAVLWLLALIPALFAGVLASPLAAESDDGTR